MEWTRAVVAVALGASLTGCVGGAMTLYEENDSLVPGKGSDKAYTQGARISRVFPATLAPQYTRGLAERTPFYEEEELNAIGLIVGQQIYTPENTRTRQLVEDDRPYAGWLYAGVVLATQKIGSLDRTDDDQHTLEVDLGVVGDESLARWAQNQVHDFRGIERAHGWDNQLDTEPGIVARYERRRRVADYCLSLGIEGDVIPTYGASLGNVDTHVELGGTARLGFALPRDFGVNTVSTTAMETGSAATDGPPSVYLFGTAQGRGVLHNIFLDGNTFSDSHSVEKKYLVGEFRGGIALQYKALRLTYTMVTLSSEFEGQNGWTKYGSLSLGLFLDF